MKEFYMHLEALEEKMKGKNDEIKGHMATEGKL